MDEMDENAIISLLDIIDSLLNLDKRTDITIANIDGKSIKYDACAGRRDANYNTDLLEYIGEGYIESIDGIRTDYTKDSKPCYFWAYKDPNKRAKTICDVFNS